MAKSTDYLGIRISTELYEDFKKYCKSREISIAFAVELLVDECIKNKNLPFLMGAHDDVLKYNGTESRKSIYLERSKRELFQEVCEKNIYLKMSNVVKAFMVYCVINNPMLPYSFDKR